MTLHDVILFAMAQPPGERPSLLVQLFPFVLMAAIFYFIVLMPLRRRQSKVKDFQASLKVGDKIVTTSGIYGAITRVQDRTVQVQIADKVRIEVSRSAVGGYQGEDPVVQDAG